MQQLPRKTGTNEKNSHKFYGGMAMRHSYGHNFDSLRNPASMPSPSPVFFALAKCRPSLKILNMPVTAKTIAIKRLG